MLKCVQLSEHSINHRSDRGLRVYHVAIRGYRKLSSRAFLVYELKKNVKRRKVEIGHNVLWCAVARVICMGVLTLQISRNLRA